MKEGLHFSYDGVDSQDMGLINVQVDTSGFFEEQFVADKEIREVSIRGREKPYFQGVHRNPLVLSLSFAFTKKYDEAKIREVARWLDQDYYKPFFTSDNPNRIFYCVLHSSSNLLHNGLKQGYVNVEFRCDSPYSYSPAYISDIYDYSTNTPEGTTLTFVNQGDVICEPEIWIKKVGNGDVSIVNHTNAGQEFKFTGLIDGETVYVDSENDYIETDVPATYRYDNFSNQFLEMVRGVNTLTVKGTCTIQFRYMFKTKQG